jgi:hypothetical protein
VDPILAEQNQEEQILDQQVSPELAELIKTNFQAKMVCVTRAVAKQHRQPPAKIPPANKPAPARKGPAKKAAKSARKKPNPKSKQNK